MSRPAWSASHMGALRWLEGRLWEAGLEARGDAAGNVIGEWHAGPGRALGVGSHLDSVPNGGRFDGALGVLGALAAVELLRERGFTPARPVWVIAFMDEEGIRFGESMFGSRAFAGENLAGYLRRVDPEGVSVAEAISRAGFVPSEVRRARAIDSLGSFLELHIEQGRVLEDAAVDVGIVTAIVGLLQAHVELSGAEDHAGATPMGARRDALAGAARVVLALREDARRRREATATVGRIAAVPGAYNVIPGRCSFSIDFRVTDPGEFAALRSEVEGLVTAIAADEELEAEIRFTDEIPPAPLDEGLIAVLEEAAEAEGATHIRLPSGAGHDTQVIAPHVPSAMLFVPSEGGVSHAPTERTRPEHCRLGVRVLARAVELITA